MGLKTEGGSFSSVEDYYVRRDISSYEEFRAVLLGAISKRRNAKLYFSGVSIAQYKSWEKRCNIDISFCVPWFTFAWRNIRGGWVPRGNVVISATYLIRYNGGDEQSLERGIKETIRRIVSPGMTSLEREKAVHDWIVNHVDYDPAWIKYLNNGRQGPDPPTSRYLAFFEGRAICSTFSALFSQMLYAAGVQNLVIEGGGHAWNLVNLCGNWYHVDVTADDSSVHSGIIDNNIYIDSTLESYGAKWDHSLYPATPTTPFDPDECQDAEPRCSVFHPELCRDELSCIRVSEHWCGGKCVDSDYWCLAVSRESVFLREGNSTNVDISGGKSPYTVTSADTGVCVVSVSGSTITVTGVTAGETDVTVSDSQATPEQVTIHVVVSAPSVCDADHLNLCTTRVDCENAGGVWGNGICSDSPNTSPTLDPQPILNPTANSVTVAADQKTSVTIAPVLNVPTADQGSTVNLYAGIVISGQLYLLKDTGPFGHPEWVLYTGGIIPSMGTATLGAVQSFNLGLNNLNLASFTGSFDIYYGYATKADLSDFVGSSYEVTVQ